MRCGTVQVDRMFFPQVLCCWAKIRWSHPKRNFLGTTVEPRPLPLVDGRRLVTLVSAEGQGESAHRSPLPFTSHVRVIPSLSPPFPDSLLSLRFVRSVFWHWPHLLTFCTIRYQHSSVLPGTMAALATVLALLVPASLAVPSKEYVWSSAS